MLEDLVDRRSKLIKWYQGFKLKMRDKFTEVITKHFFEDLTSR